MHTRSTLLRCLQAFVLHKRTLPQATPIKHAHNAAFNSQQPRFLCSNVMPGTEAVLALGSNLGNRALSMHWAIQQLNSRGIQVLRCSSLYETAPAYVTDQPTFLNAAVLVHTGLSAPELLGVLKDMEVRAGRDLGGLRWGPRPLDLDIIFFGSGSYKDSALEVPHPRWSERTFVTVPVSDLWYDTDASPSEHSRASHTHVSGPSPFASSSSSSSSSSGSGTTNNTNTNPFNTNITKLPPHSEGSVHDWLQRAVHIATQAVSARLHAGARNQPDPSSGSVAPSSIPPNESTGVGGQQVGAHNAQQSQQGCSSHSATASLRDKSHHHHHHHQQQHQPQQQQQQQQRAHVPQAPTAAFMRGGSNACVDAGEGGIMRRVMPLGKGGRAVVWGTRTHIMGILNVTPDSFSDGGRFVGGAEQSRGGAAQSSNPGGGSHSSSSCAGNSDGGRFVGGVEQSRGGAAQSSNPGGGSHSSSSCAGNSDGGRFVGGVEQNGGGAAHSSSQTGSSHSSRNSGRGATQLGEAAVSSQGGGRQRCSNSGQGSSATQSRGKAVAVPAAMQTGSSHSSGNSGQGATQLGEAAHSRSQGGGRLSCDNSGQASSATGEAVDVPAAVQAACEMAAQGADIIDVGGQSTRPGAVAITEAEEIARVVPVIRALKSHPDLSCVLLSVDTHRAEVARQAAQAGADMVNDVSGGTLDADMLPTVASIGIPYVLMHMRGDPTTMTSAPNTQYGCVWQDVGAELQARVDRAVQAGIPAWNLLLDPGIGFAKKPQDNLSLIQNLSQIRQQCLQGAARHAPLLVGHSRKRFLANLVGKPPAESDIATAAATVALVGQGTDVVRVHNVDAARDAALVGDAVYRH